MVIEKTIFQQERELCHTCKLVKSWVAWQLARLKSYREFTGQHLKKVSVKLLPSHADLCEKNKQVRVNEITVDYCKWLVHSLSDRIKAVIMKNKRTSNEVLSVVLVLLFTITM